MPQGFTKVQAVWDNAQRGNAGVLRAAGRATPLKRGPIFHLVFPICISASLNNANMRAERERVADYFHG